MSSDQYRDTETYFQPIHYFPGDETIAPATYRWAIANHYLTIMAIITGATGAFGLAVDAPTFERWKRIASAGRLIDTYLDSPPDKGAANVLYQDGLSSVLAGGVPAELPAGADGRLLPSLQLLRNCTTELTYHQRERMVAAASRIGSIAVDKAGCSRVDDYIMLLKEEAHQASMLVTEPVTEQVRQQPQYEDFRAWSEASLEVAIIGDHAVDLWRDNRSGVTLVPATLQNFIQLAYATRPAIKKLTHRLVGQRACIAALQGWRWGANALPKE